MPPRQRRGRAAGDAASSPSRSPPPPPRSAAAGGGTPATWAAATAASLALLAYATMTFHTAFPITSLEITMDRDQALQSAAALADEYSLRPAVADDGVRQAVDFESADDVQVFVELDHGLQTWFKMLQRAELPSFSPYYWIIRHFREGDIAETEIFFNPLGDALGFSQKLPESEPGAALSEEDARAVAVALVTSDQGRTRWSVDLERYTEVEHLAEDRTGGRRDHSFTFELKDEAITVPLGDGKHRLSLHVAGDQVCGLRRFIHVPEAFSRGYAEMRSANESIAYAATIAFYVLYFFLGILVGGFVLLRQRRLLPRPAAYCGVTMGVLGVLETLNESPLSWMQYDTAKPVTVHHAELAVSVMSGLLFKSLLSTMLFAAAEGLDRAAFGDHKQMFRVTDRSAAASTPVATEVALGYLCVPAFFAYAVTFYRTALHSGWWLPSSSLSDPNVVAMYFPWYQPLAEAFSAGILEEAMFRVIPIAGSTLLYRRFVAQGTPEEKSVAEPSWWWFVLTQTVQAVIFGAAHANYPAQPAYARLVELIVPSLAFAFLYLRYGIVAGMTLHWLYDVVWMGLPIFTTQLFVAQGLVVLISAAPAMYVLHARIKEGRWLALSPKLLNVAWVPPKDGVQSDTAARVAGGPANIDGSVWRALPFAALLFVGVWCNQTNLGRCKHAPVLTLTRDEAVAAAIAEVAQLHPDFVGYNASTGDKIPGGWRVMTAVLGTQAVEDMFVFETDPNHVQCGPLYSPFDDSGGDSSIGGESVYTQQMNAGFLVPPHWSVRIARFDCDCDLDVSDRAEELAVGVANDNSIVWVQHEVPEHFAGNNLTEPEAQAIALELAGSAISGPLKVISSGPVKRIARLDWSVTFTHGPKLIHPGFDSDTPAEAETTQEAVEGESRIEVRLVDGKLAGWSKFIHVPEVWNRHERSDKTAVQVILRGFSILYTLVSMLTGLLALAVWGAGWAGVYQSGVFWRTLGILMALHACATFNQFESVQHQFPTSQPWMSTAAQTVAQQMFQAFSRSLLAAFQFSLAITLKPQRTDKTKGQPDGNGGPLVKFGPGIVIGLGLIAAHYGLIGMWQRERPVWPGLVDANAAWPPVAVLPLHVTLRFLHDVPLALLAMTAATLLFPDSGDVYAAPPAMSKLSLYFIPARLIVAAPAMLSTVTWGALLPWTAAQMVTGLGMSAAFRLVYRHDLSQLPIAYALGTHSAHTSLKCTQHHCHALSVSRQAADDTAGLCICPVLWFGAMLAHSCGGAGYWRVDAARTPGLCTSGVCSPFAGLRCHYGPVHVDLDL
jgi:hypothetical protein